jgi:hypothetical protein
MICRLSFKFPEILCRALPLALLLCVPCSSALFAQEPEALRGAAKPEKGFHTSQERQKAAHDALLFTPGTISTVDVVQGPEQDKKEFQLHYNDKVICDFATPGKQMNGKTQKFGCKITSVVSADGTVQTLTPEMKESDPVKVKFDPHNNEVYAEVASTRLLWAIGYYADGWFPVHVECHNCPADVISGSGPVGTKTFYPAIIVRKFPWHEMTEIGKDNQGWSWAELDALNGRPTYERDGIKLLAAFIQHSDNKPEQQRVVCHKVIVDDKSQPPSTTCDKSVMLVQDVGASFGSGGLFTSNDGAKMNIDNWSHTKLWSSVGTDASPKECHASLRKSLTAHGGLSNPSISEEGRRFDAQLLCQLSDHQIEDIFKLSQAAEMPKYHNSDGSFKTGIDENAVIRQWVAAFKAKREDLASGRCLWKEKPQDPAWLQTASTETAPHNYCTAKLF